MRVWKTVPANEGLDRPRLATRKAKEHRELHGCCVKVVEVDSTDTVTRVCAACEQNPGLASPPGPKPGTSLLKPGQSVCWPRVTCHLLPP